MITFDYGGGRGGLAIDYVIKNRKIFRGFLKFSNGFSTKIFIISRKFFQNFLKMKNFRDRTTIFRY